MDSGRKNLRKLIEEYVGNYLSETILREEEAEAEDVDFSAGMNMMVDGLKNLIDSYSKYSSIKPDESMLEDLSEELEELELALDRIKKILRL